MWQGDHAYNEGDGDERRADGYMQAYEQTIANAPWMPIVGSSQGGAPPTLGKGPPGCLAPTPLARAPYAPSVPNSTECAGVLPPSYPHMFCTGHG